MTAPTDPQPAPAARGPRTIPADGTYPTWPTNGTHTWNAFAGLAIEFEGYNDAMVIDPNTGEKLYIPDLTDGEFDLAQVLRKIADAVETTGFGRG